jgi:hypothetical protein
MSSWEYKLISSGPLGFASMQLLEQHLSQLGKDEWEIINFTTKPDNPLVFNGLARRPVARDWFPPAEAKPAYVPPPMSKEEEEDDRDERSFAEDLPPARPANAPATADLGLGDFDDLGGSFDDLGGSEEDLPTLFEALQPFLRKNPRGDLSVDLDFLAKKFEQDPRELLTAFEECGLKTPAQPEEKGDVVDHDGSLYWLERDKRGRVWVNTRDKKFKTAKTTPVPAEPRTESEPAAERAPAPEGQRNESRHERRHDQRQEGRQPDAAREPKSFLGKIRSMMRRNHRGHGWSGSFPYMTKALKFDEAQLLEELGKFGLRLPSEGEAKPPLAPDGDFVFWLNKNQRGEIWINAQLARDVKEPGAGSPSTDSAGSPQARAGSGDKESEAVGRGFSSSKASATEEPPKSGPEASTSGAGFSDTKFSPSQREYVDPRVEAPAAKSLPPENTLTAVRLLMQPKKRGEGVTAQVKDLARELEKTDEQLLAALAQAGLELPESPKAKPTFAEHGGEIFWLNVNPKGQVWLNAKVTAAKKARAKKSAD